MAPSEQAAPAPGAAQVKEFEAWLAKQPREPIVAAADGAAVVIVKFNDYQCPPCRQTFMEYKPILAKWAKQAPGKVKFITKDFALERECNAGVSTDVHPAACDAAVAVRLAREKGKAEAMEEWLFANQPTLTPASVRQAAKDVGGVLDMEARYQGTLDAGEGRHRAGRAAEGDRHADVLHERHAPAGPASRVLRRRHRLGAEPRRRRRPVVVAAIETDDLSKDFLVGFWRPRPYRALDRLTLSVDEGEVFGFLGPNGAGKSTTLKLLMQLLYPTSGAARILGRPVGDLAVKQRIGFLPENPYFYDHLTAEELLRYFGAPVRPRRHGRSPRASPACSTMWASAPSGGCGSGSTRRG